MENTSRAVPQFGIRIAYQIVTAKNIGFLIQNVPFASKKAEEHFHRTIELSKELDMKSYLGLAYLGLGMLYKATNRSEDAKRNILEAIDLFKKCNAKGYFEQASEALKSLNAADT